MRLKRLRIVTNSEPTINDAFHALIKVAAADQTRARFVKKLTEQDGPSVAHELKRRDSKLYSASEIGALLGTSKATAHRWQVTGKENARHPRRTAHI